MSRSNALPANPAPATKTTQREPSRIQPRPYSFFRPFPKLPERWRSPEAQDRLLHEWLISRQSIPDFATSRELTVDQVFDWLHSEQIVDRRKRMEHMAAQRAESLARLNLPDAVGTLAATMRDENALPKERRLAASAIVRAVAQADKQADKQAALVSHREAHPKRERAGRPHPSNTSTSFNPRIAGPAAPRQPGVASDPPPGPAERPDQSASRSTTPNSPHLAAIAPAHPASSRAAPRTTRSQRPPKPILARIGPSARKRAGSPRPPRRPSTQ